MNKYIFFIVLFLPMIIKSQVIVNETLNRTESSLIINDSLNYEMYMIGGINDLKELGDLTSVLNSLHQKGVTTYFIECSKADEWIFFQNQSQNHTKRNQILNKSVRKQFEKDYKYLLKLAFFDSLKIVAISTDINFSNSLNVLNNIFANNSLNDKSNNYIELIKNELSNEINEKNFNLINSYLKTLLNIAETNMENDVDRNYVTLIINEMVDQLNILLKQPDFVFIHNHFSNYSIQTIKNYIYESKYSEKYCCITDGFQLLEGKDLELWNRNIFHNDSITTFCQELPLNICKIRYLRYNTDNIENYTIPYNEIFSIFNCNKSKLFIVQTDKALEYSQFSYNYFIIRNRGRLF